MHNKSTVMIQGAVLDKVTFFLVLSIALGAVIFIVLYSFGLLQIKI